MAKRPIDKQLADLVEEWSPQLRAAFLAAVADLTSNAAIGLIVERLERNDIGAALRAVNLDPAAFRVFENAVAQTYSAGGTATTGAMPTLRDPTGNRLVIRFDVRNPRAEAWLRQHSSSLVTRVVDDQRNAIRQAMEAGMLRGDNPRTTALDIVGRINRATGRREGGIVGLTQQQASFVENARQELQEGTREALERYLQRARRDKRFDRSIMKAIREGKPVPADLQRKALARYADSLLQLRGETIARTEAMASLHAAQVEAFEQAIDTGSVARQDVRKVWVATSDGRTRDTHRALGGESVGFDDQFVSPSGARLRFPGDPEAPASEIVACRCTMRVRVDFLSNLR